MLDFEDGKGDDPERLLKPCKNWALDQGAETRKMAYVLTQIAGAPAQMMHDMRARLNDTQGMHVQKKPKRGPPSFTKQNLRDIAKRAIQSMVESRPNNAGETFNTIQSNTIRYNLGN